MELATINYLLHIATRLSNQFSCNFKILCILNLDFVATGVLEILSRMTLKDWRVGFFNHETIPADLHFRF